MPVTPYLLRGPRIQIRQRRQRTLNKISEVQSYSDFFDVHMTVLRNMDHDAAGAWCKIADRNWTEVPGSSSTFVGCVTLTSRLDCYHCPRRKRDIAFPLI